MTSRNLNKTFTLIEMLIVIVIIGILAAALVPRLQSVQGRARDTKRIADISQLHSALMIYKTDNGTYPIASNSSITCGLNTNCYAYSNQSNGTWLSGVLSIMTNTPTDPINQNPTFISHSGSWLTGNYVYQYGNLYKNGTAFTLMTQLESEQNSNRCQLNNYEFLISTTTYNCNGANLYGRCRRCPYLYIRSDL